MNLLSTVILTLALAASIVHGQNFAPPQSIGPAWYAGTCTADLDNDGDLDIVTPRISGSPAQIQLAWYENLGPHTWGTTISATAQFIPSSPGIWDVHSADLDGDGDMDLVTVIPLAPSTTGGEVRWHENLGNGALWTTHVLNASAAYPRGSTTADIDGDGHLDILTADVGVVWYRNDGAGGFIQQPPLASGTGGQVSTARGADVDGDGDLDVLAARKGDAKVTWFENLGAGAMGPGQDISSSAINTYGAIACDLDGDNDLDVVFIANNPDKVAWHENLGAGAFGPEQTLSLLSTDLRDLAVSDLDLDGDLDLVTGASGNDRVAWFENNGTGGFGPEQFIVNSRNTIDIHVADLDSDGAPDILTSRSPSLDVIWVKNTGQITWPVRFPGVTSSLTFDLQVNGISTSIGIPPVSAGDTINGLLSSSGSYVGTPSVIGMQAMPIANTQFTDLQLDLSQPIEFIQQGSLLPSTGIPLVVTIPAGLPPVSLMVQAACLAPFTPVGPPPIVGPGNPYFTAADAYEVRIQ